MTRPTVKTGRKRHALSAIDVLIQSENESLVRATRLQLMIEDATRDYWIVELVKNEIADNISRLQALRDNIENQNMKPTNKQ